MAENKNRSGNGANWAEEPPFDGERPLNKGKSEAHMPPRNILETDSAKYTAEFVKGVVKGLYTSDPDVYETGADYEFGSADEPPEDYIEPAAERDGRFTAARQDLRMEPEFEPEPELKPQPRSVKRAERAAAPPPEEYPAIKQERPRPISPARPAKPAKPEKPVKPVKMDAPLDIAEDEVLAADGFLKAYEEKNRSDRPSFTKKTQRRTFSSLSAGDGVSELEGVLSGRQPKRHISPGDGVSELEGVLSGRQPKRHISPSRGETSFDGGFEEEEEYVYIKPDAYRRHSSPHDAGNPPEGDAVYRKISHGGPEIEEKEGFTSVPAYEQVEPRQQEKIPIIINKRIEGKPRKTADDYRNVSKSEYDRQPKKQDSYRPPAPRGPSVIMAAFMVAAIIIIGLLVWKINSLSSGDSQYDAEEAASLREENSLLKKENGEWESKYNALLSENESLRDENDRLETLLASEPEPSSEDEQNGEQESAPSADGLVDGYYTVESGDNFWSIAERFLGNGDMYPQILAASGLPADQQCTVGLRLKIPAQ